MNRARYIVSVGLLGFISVFVAQSADAAPSATSSVASSSAFQAAASTTDPSSELQIILRELVDRVRSLEDTVSSLEKKLAISKAEQIFSRDLQFGSSGRDVKKLQEVLKAIPGVYPEGLVTGYYGPRTKKAILNFQERENIETTGKFDEDTKAALVEIATPPTNTGDLEQADNNLEDQIANLNFEDAAPSPDISSSSAAAAATTTAASTTSQPEDVSTLVDTALLEPPPQEPSAPVAPPPPTSSATPTPPPAQTPTVLTINNVSAQNITASSTNIRWTTNVPADSRVEFGPAPKYRDGALDLKLVTSHSVSLTNLEKNATYHYMAKSLDANGNAATSSDQTFTTLAK